MTGHLVARERAEVLRAAVAEKWAAYITDGEPGPELVDGTTLPSGESFGAEWIVAWETGPFGWSGRDLLGEDIDEELTAEVQDIKPGLVIRDKALGSFAKAKLQSAGIRWEPGYSYTLHIYPAGA